MSRYTYFTKPIFTFRIYLEGVCVYKLNSGICQAQSEIDPFAQFKIDPPVNFFLSFSTFNLACFSF